MKVSVITSTYNCIDELQVTIDSIKDNNTLDIEWIVVDGASNDGTVELIEKNIGLITKFISEEDNGIYDAWNKGCRLIEGDWVVFLGAGDYFNRDNLLSFLNELSLVNYHKFKVVYGNVDLVNLKNNRLKTYKEIDPNDWSNGRPSLPSHQGTFQHSSLFSAYNVFDSKYNIAADSKFLCQAAVITEFKYIDITVSSMKIYGVSTNPIHILRVKKELEILRAELNLQMPKEKLFVFNIKSYLKYGLSSFWGGRVFKLVTKIYCFISFKEYLY